jgi:hypothetical protein
LTGGFWRSRAVIIPLPCPHCLRSYWVNQLVCHSVSQRTMPITNPAICEVRLVIQFLNAKNFYRVESIANLLKCMGKVSWTRWTCMRGVICLMGEWQMCTKKHDVHENRWFTIHEPHKIFPYVLQFVFYEIVTVFRVETG